MIFQYAIQIQYHLREAISFGGSLNLAPWPMIEFIFSLATDDFSEKKSLVLLLLYFTRPFFCF